MSTQAQPAHISLFNEIIHELNKLVQRDPDEFTRIKRLHEIEAKTIALGDYDRSLFFSAMGSIASARGDAMTMQRYHEKSIQNSNMPLICALILSRSASCTGMRKHSTWPCKHTRPTRAILIP